MPSAIIGTPIDTDTTLAGNSDSNVPSQKAVKTYIDATIADFDIKNPVVAATTSALPFSPMYSNGTNNDGIGATLTGSIGILAFDGYTPVLGDRLLIKNQASTLTQGVYTVTTVGTAIIGYVLTRATDFNQSANILYGDTVAVLQGTVNANQQFTMNNQTAITVGTTAITFAQTSGGSQLSAGNGISITGNVIAVAASITDLISIASAAATSADAHANAISARVVSVSAELASIVQIASAAATSADGHANVVSARAASISNELGSLVQIASAAATSADGHANTVSARAVSISNELGSLVQIASAAATSADAHANAVSVRAVSISNEVASLINIVSARVVSVSNELGSLVQIASAAATSADAHANTVSARAVSISAELASLVQIASLAATSADGHANTVSARAVSVSNELGSLVQIASAAATSADAHANTVSQRAVSISNELGSLLASAAPIKAVNTAAQASITVSTGITISGVSVALVSARTYAFEFQIPFTTTLPSGITVQVIAPATTTFAVQYQVPGQTGQAGVSPSAIGYLMWSSGNAATRYSTVSITLTGVSVFARAIGMITPSANGSLKFLIGPNVSGTTSLNVLQGANLRVWRMV